MEQQDMELLERLGYKTGSKSVRFFNDLIKEVEEAMKIYSHEEVVELVKNKNSFIYVEMKMFYEIGLNRIPDELKRINREMRDIKKCDMETYAEVFGSNYNPTTDETIISIASYRSGNKIPETKATESKKVFVKKEKNIPTIAYAM